MAMIVAERESSPAETYAGPPVPVRRPGIQRHHEAFVPSSAFRSRPPVWSLRLCVTGAHGGAGASTIARLLGEVDVGRFWPDPARGLPPHVLMVARTHAAGLTAVSRTLARLHDRRYPPGTHLLGVVLVADAPGRLTRQLTRRITVLASATALFRVPWVREWRLGEITKSGPALAEGLRRFVEDARAHLGEFTCAAPSSMY